MAEGCKIILKLDVTVDELLLIQKNWKASGCRSLQEHVLKILLVKPAQAAEVST